MWTQEPGMQELVRELVWRELRKIGTRVREWDPAIGDIVGGMQPSKIKARCGSECRWLDLSEGKSPRS